MALGGVSALRLGAILLVLAGLPACSSDEEEPGRMVLSLYADMAIPKDIDTLQIEVFSGGALRMPPDPIPIGAGGQLLPATLTLVGNSDPATTATVNIWASSAGRPVTLRRVVTQIPPKRLSLLRVPIQWLCKGNVTDTGGVPISKCPEGKSCVSGECVDDSDNSLPTFGTGDVFGGGNGADPATGTCFDTVTCLDQGFDVAVQMSDCSLSLPAGSESTLNVGLVTELGADGICGRKDCYVPLDKSDLFGWSIDAGRIKLPAEACKRITLGSVTAVRLATGPCQSKVVQVPTCGPWSSVGSSTEQESAECLALCKLIAASGCEEDRAERCFSRCYPAAGVCDAIVADYTKCGESFPFTKCTTTAEVRTKAAPECTVQAERFQVCRKCARAARDECDYCTCSACEKEITDCDSDAGCAKILECAEQVGCRGTACNVACKPEIDASPSAAALFSAIGACQTASPSCQSKCSGT